jgi:hypothetical protein
MNAIRLERARSDRHRVLFADPDIDANEPTMDFGHRPLSDKTVVQFDLWVFNHDTSDLHSGAIGGLDPLAPPFSQMGSVPATLRCANRTTGQVVQETLNDATQWDCLQAGLVANNDRVRVFVFGQAESHTIDRTTATRISRDQSNMHTPAPELVVNPLFVDFGWISTIQGEAVEAATLQNNNDVPVHFSEIATTNPVAEPFFVVDPLSHGICAVHSNCAGTGGLQIGMRLVDGEYSDSFSITSDDPVNPAITVQVVG